MNKRSSLLVSICMIVSACQGHADGGDNTAQGKDANSSASLLDRAREIPFSFQGYWAASEAACSTPAATAVIGSRTFDLGDMKAVVASVRTLDPLNVVATLKLNEAKEEVHKLSLSGTGDRLTLTTGTNTLGLIRCAAPVKPDEEVKKLYEEVKRLNNACVDAGGGVSGSPDCETATIKEENLEKLGYCIDYPNNEKLAKCNR